MIVIVFLTVTGVALPARPVKLSFTDIRFSLRSRRAPSAVSLKLSVRDLPAAIAK